MSKYYLMMSNGAIKTINHFLSINEDEHNLLINTEFDQFSVCKKDVVIHGDEKYWTKVLELLKCLDKIIQKRVNKITTKATFLGFFLGRLS
ncbi:hypothetical protein BBF96_10230 [Anoxybacter fermentans]|uniref:Uncharacterized protein n=1 Tax=Anoxybacter fermentans TaxID=1323375 RepID=A0A3Q9HRH0_9FIRM|nr:hypothetical protein [Anoxybacter fermentans]AZR73728.1 hypothetical protein BBF96_10230 [Anoxybacter fermentans]